jgi:hypothetical protein
MILSRGVAATALMILLVAPAASFALARALS